MTNIPPELPLLCIAAAAIWAIIFPWAYFTHIRFADNQKRRLQVFVSVTSLALLLACFTAYRETIAQYRIDVMVFPAEHAFSAQKVGLIFGTALAASLVAWGMAVKESPSSVILPLGMVLPLAVVAAFCSLFSIHVSSLGWCCESPLAVFAGFPFSMMHGNTGLFSLYDYKILSPLSLIDILKQYGSSISWVPHLSAMIIDLLFWTEIAFLLTILFKTIQQVITSRNVRKNLNMG